MPIYNNKDYTNLMRPLPKMVKRDIFGIPFIEKQEIDISFINNGIWLINQSNMSSKDKNSKKKIVHSFSYDKVLEREYNRPLDYLKKAARYYASTSFDFSMHKGMEEAQIIDATFKNRWMGAFLQCNGLNIIATVGWVDSKTYDICFSGLRDGAIFMISTLGVNNEISHEDFINGYKELRFRFPNSKLICVGKRVEGMDDDVCYIDFTQSFGNFDKYHNYWQPKLFNWDLSDGGIL